MKLYSWLWWVHRFTSTIGKTKYWFWTAARAALESVQPANYLRTDLLFHQHESHCSHLFQSLYMTLIYKQIWPVMAIESTVVAVIWWPLVSQNVLHLLCFFLEIDQHSIGATLKPGKTQRTGSRVGTGSKPAPEPPCLKRCIPVKVNQVLEYIHLALFGSGKQVRDYVRYCCSGNSIRLSVTSTWVGIWVAFRNSMYLCVECVLDEVHGSLHAPQWNTPLHHFKIQREKAALKFTTG